MSTATAARQKASVPVSTEAPRRQYRKFDGEYIDRILAEMDNAQHGGRRVILEREELSAGQVANWRKRREITSVKRRRSTKVDKPTFHITEMSLGAIERQIERLQHRLKTQKELWAIKDEVDAMLGLSSPNSVKSAHKVQATS